MKVLYISHLLEQSGWGKASRDILSSMDLAGIDVVARAIPMNNPTAHISERHIELLNKSSKNCDIVIQHVLPNLYEYDGHFQKNIGMFYSETGNLHYTPYFSYLGIMDELWVPSKKMQEQCCESEVCGSVCNIVVIPHPFNNIVKEDYQPLDIPECKNDYVFYYIGEATRRKNMSALIRAFHSEFSFNEPVQLVIKANRSGMSNQDTANLVNQFAQAAKENLKLYDNLNKYKQEIIITSDMTDDDINRLHRTCHCFVMPSCGEAINLPAMDALMFGNRVVCTGNTGMREFINDGVNGWLVNSIRQPCYGMTEGFNDMYTARETCEEIDELSLKVGMRWAYESRNIPLSPPTYPTLLDTGNKIKERLNG